VRATGDGVAVLEVSCDLSVFETWVGKSFGARLTSPEVSIGRRVVISPMSVHGTVPVASKEELPDGLAPCVDNSRFDGVA